MYTERKREEDRGEPERREGETIRDGKKSSCSSTLGFTREERVKAWMDVAGFTTKIK